MPRVDWDARETWDLFYGHRGFGYRRATAYGELWGHDPEDSHYARRRDHLIALGIQPADRILCVGGGFGFLIERFHAAGYPNCWGIENSSWINTNRRANIDDSVLWVEDDFTGGGRIRNALRQMSGDDTFTWVIDEGMLVTLREQEMAPYFSSAESVLATDRPLTSIVHLVWLGPFNAVPSTAVTIKPLDEWKALSPQHTFMDAVTGDFL